MGLPSSPTATSMHHPYGTYVPSTSTNRWATPPSPKRGRTFQHQSMARRNVGVLTPIDAAAACMEAVPVTQRRNAWNWAIRVLSSRLRTLLVWQESHLQRCFPAEVVPFLRIGEPHMSHSLALGDLARAMRPAHQ